MQLMLQLCGSVSSLTTCTLHKCFQLACSPRYHAAVGDLKSRLQDRQLKLRRKVYWLDGFQEMHNMF